ncbi:hypothetical protein Patl1_33400 [Pistacia atlantica]|uniref:Uncharacterized protein n=1 Tax=Pistacia atlantica TaxID=434234 RepID=A0ACC0ZSN9_9ROSI|nr:hypothetical protein Patl1_33400 [Pistacia atlantica]
MSWNLLLQIQTNGRKVKIHNKSNCRRDQCILSPVCTETRLLDTELAVSYTFYYKSLPLALMRL